MRNGTGNPPQDPEATQPGSELPGGTGSPGGPERGDTTNAGRADACSGPESATLIPRDESVCVWMEAGVLSYWLCELRYQCERCPLDAALRHARQQSNADFATSPPDDPTMGRVREVATPRQAAMSAEVSALLDLHLPEPDPCLHYHAAHTWVRFESPSRARVGIDHFASKIVGPLRGVVLPHPGTRVRRGHPCAWLDQDGGTLTVLAPLSGILEECNIAATGNPGLVCSDPQGAGWLFSLQPTRLEAEQHRLMSNRTFERRMTHDAQCWRRRVLHALRTSVPDVGHTLADGGTRITDIHALLGARRLVEIAVQFLSPAWARR